MVEKNVYTVYRTCAILDGSVSDQVVVATTNDLQATRQLLESLRGINEDKLYDYFAFDNNDQSIESEQTMYRCIECDTLRHQSDIDINGMCLSGCY